MANIYKLLLSLCLVAILPLFSHAKSSKNDTAYWEEQLRESNEYWKERTAIAQKANREAYVVDPYEVTANVSSIVSLQTKSGRRNLKEKKGGGCMATNPIDKCWMCDPNWEQNRKKLADCVIGFGKNTVGGKYGPIYVVTDSSDNELINLIPGTLRHAVTRTGPLWIIFAHDMVIRLSEELLMSSDKTIDGRGVDVHIANGAGITIQSAKNVIIHGIKIHNIFSGKGGMVRDSESHWGLRTRSDGDGISILDSSNIWIDHVTLKKSSDGLIDVISGSTAVTISNNFFAHQNKVMLFGANDFHTQDEIMQITVAFNRFGQKCVQRMPRCRRGFFHLVNNDYHHWEMYAIGGSMHPTIISEGNRFEAPFNIFAKEVTKRETTEDVWIKWQWRSTGDLFLNGAYFRESGPKFLNNAFFNKEMITAKHGVYVKMLTRTAGALECKPHKLCHAKIASEKQ